MTDCYRCDEGDSDHYHGDPRELADRRSLQDLRYALEDATDGFACVKFDTEEDVPVADVEVAIANLQNGTW